MNDEEIKELHEILIKYAVEKRWRNSQILAFLTSTLVGTMAIQGYDQDFADSTFDLMKKRFEKHPERVKKWDGDKFK